MLADFLHWVGLGWNGTIQHLTAKPNDFIDACIIGLLVTVFAIGWGLFVALLIWVCNGCKSNT
jgi:hypothetical protein